MTVMLRVNPARPLLWRDARSVQFGVPPVAALDDPAPWQERLLHELERGIAEPAVAVWGESVGIAARHLRAFLATLGPAVQRTRTPDRETQPARVDVLTPPGRGDAVLAQAVGFALAADGWAARVVEGDDGAHDTDADAHPDTDTDAAPEVAVLVADHVLDLRRTRSHLSRDRPHVPVVATGSGVLVGPLVNPGTSACAVCVELHTRDDDSAWPMLRTQLLQRRPPPVRVADALAAASSLLEILGTERAWRAGAPDALCGQVWTVTGESTARRLVDRHPECGCVVPTGTGSGADVALRPAGAHAATWRRTA